MFDGVAACGDRILEPLASEHVASRLAAEPMRLIDQGLQYRQWIRRHVLRLAGGTERIGTAREQLDPIRTAVGVLAHRRPCLLS